MRSEILLLWGSGVVTMACLGVLLLRGLLRRLAGAGAAYRLWMLPPLALLTAMLPAPAERIVPMHALPSLPVAAMLPRATSVPLADVGWLVCALWSLGVLASLLLQWRAQRRFRYGLGDLRGERRGRLKVLRASVDAGLPALVGLWRPQIVLPIDFERRYRGPQRALLLRHELVHWRRGDAWANALAALLRALQWFNPLVHHAYTRFRRDQELACDARVMALRPRQKSRYADALLRGSLGNAGLAPLACAWAAHPLKERIQMLRSAPPDRHRATLAWLLAMSLATLTAGAAWAAQPARAPATAIGGERWYRTEVDLRVDGDSRRFGLLERAGQWLAFESGDRADAWQARLRWTTLDDRRLQLDLELRREGVLVASPKMIVERDDPQAAFEASSPDGRSRFAATLRAIPASAPSPAQADATEASDLAPPRYPAQAYAQGIGGRVVLLVDVRADGSVGEAVVERSEPRGVFDASALAAARQWHFKPAMEQGTAVAGRLRVPVEFEVDHSAGVGEGAMP